MAGRQRQRHRRAGVNDREVLDVTSDHAGRIEKTLLNGRVSTERQCLGRHTGSHPTPVNLGERLPVLIESGPQDDSLDDQKSDQSHPEQPLQPPEAPSGPTGLGHGRAWSSQSPWGVSRLSHRLTLTNLIRIDLWILFRPRQMRQSSAPTQLDLLSEFPLGLFLFVGEVQRARRRQHPAGPKFRELGEP